MAKKSDTFAQWIAWIGIISLLACVVFTIVCLWDFYSVERKQELTKYCLDIECTWISKKLKKREPADEE